MESKVTMEVANGRDLVLEKVGSRSPPRINGHEFSSRREECRSRLPAQPTALLGRDAELNALCQTLLQGETRLLTLTGPGGVGKTRLAIELARSVQHAFSDGVVFVDLALGSEPDLVSSAIARALGVQSTTDLAPLDSLKDLLANRHLLLLLDHFDRLVNTAAVVGELVAWCPALTAIVTSREPLHLRWERVRPIPPLPLPNHTASALEDLEQLACIQLFVQRAQAICPDFALTESNAPDVVELCVQLDGLPLALELQAARINVLTPSAMVARLDQRLSLLHRPAPDIPARHRSLEAALQWSFDQLDEREQALLQRLAVFVGGFDLDAAVAVAALEGPEVTILEQLASLVDKSLVVAETYDGREPRFHLLETVRTYVLDQARQQGELARAEEKHCLYFLSLAERSVSEAGGPQQRVRFARLDREYENVREALRWAAGSGDETELRLALALLPYWRAHGYVWEGIRYLTEALARHTGGDVARHIEALDGLAHLLRWEGRFEPARTAIDEALSLAVGSDDSTLVARLLLNQGMLLTSQGQLEAARAVLEECLDRWRELHGTREVALTMQYRGITQLSAGDYRGARVLLTQSLAMFQELRDLGGVASGLTVLGRLASVQGETVGAAVPLVEALKISRELTDRRLMCLAVEQAANVLASQVEPVDVGALLGAVDAVRRVAGFVRNAFEEPVYDEARAVLVARTGEQSVQNWLDAGASLTIEQAADRALAFLASAAASPVTVQPVKADTGKLSRREYEVLQFIAQGLSNKQIAHALQISENTVKYHVTSLLNKLGADSRAQTVALAAQLNLLRSSG